MPLTVLRKKELNIHVDAIVTPAAGEFGCKGETEMAIYKAAGKRKLLKMRKKIGCVAPCGIAVTPAFSLPAKYIIHVGEPYESIDEIALCYRKAISMAHQLGCVSVAVPLFCTDVEWITEEKSLSIAMEVAVEFLSFFDMDIIILVLENGIPSHLIQDVSVFVEANYRGGFWDEESTAIIESEETSVKTVVALGSFFRKKMRVRVDDLLDSDLNEDSEPTDFYESVSDESYEDDAFARVAEFHQPLDAVLKQKEESFQEKLLHLIDEHGLTDVEVYKKANIDRKLFSKIRCNTDYIPKKKTAIAFAIALELSINDTMDLLQRAGLALSPSNKGDLIVEYCIMHHIYNIFDVDALLFEYGQPLIGC